MNANDILMLKTAYKAIDSKFGTDISVLDISKLTSVADYFVIATGPNVNAIRSMVDELEQKLHEAGFPMTHAEGLHSANWVLMDFSNMIVHIFDKENRSFYNLERIWSDAVDINVNSL